MHRAIKVPAGKRARLLALVALEPLSAGRLDFGSNGGAQAQEKRQRKKTG